MDARGLTSSQRKLVMWYKVKELKSKGLHCAQIAHELGLQLVVSLGFIYLCPSSVLAHWLYLLCALIVLSIAYILFKKKYYHLHEEYLRGIGKI